MHTSSPANRNQTAESFKLRRPILIAEFRVLLNKALQALKGTPDDYEKTLFNTTGFHRFHLPLFKLFSTPLNDQTDSAFIINPLLNHFLNQNNSLDTFHEHKSSDAEKI